MFALSLIASLALVPFVAAQSLEIKAIEAHFTQSAIVPDLFSSFNPSALLSLNFAGVGVILPGQSLTKEQVGPTPAVTVSPANTSVSLSGTYTLAMVDADVVGSKLPQGQTRHWLVNGVTVSAEGSSVSIASGIAITTYAGPAPAAGSGPHRYVVALYDQPSTFKAPAAFSQPNIGVSTFDFNGYVKDSGLGQLLAATYMTVEEGVATASISPTSSVVSSTLIPSSSSSAQSSSGTSSGAAPAKSSGAADIAAHFSAVTFAVAGLLMAVRFM